MKKMLVIKNILNFAVFSIITVALSLSFLLTPDESISKAERRPLMKFQEVMTAENPFEVFESYMLDQFPMREGFRKIKALFFMDVLHKNDNNDIYKHDGTVVKIEDTLDEAQVNKTINLMNQVISTYYGDREVFYSIIPDKHYYASQENGYPAMDYGKLLEMLDENVNADYIDITGTLELSDYYSTDSHWSQEKIVDTAQLLASSMSSEINLTPDGGYTENVLEPFYGVYYGQSALSLPPDKICYLTSKYTSSMKMTVVNDKGYPETHPVYTLDKFSNVDPYDVFTAGAQPFITIENPNANSKKELVLFRDSFGSSIAPLFAHGYSKVTMIDLRYMFPDAIGMFMRTLPEDADILFLYSTGLINGGGTLRGFMSQK